MVPLERDNVVISHQHIIMALHGLIDHLDREALGERCRVCVLMMLCRLGPCVFMLRRLVRVGAFGVTAICSLCVSSVSAFT